MKRNQNSIFSTRRLVLMAALIAIYLVLMGPLSIKASDTLRISLEAIPIALAGMWLGPVSGMIVALVSDFLGAILFYGSWFPPIALGPVFFAVFCGWSTQYMFHSSLSETRDTWKVIAITVFAGIVNAFVIGVLTTTLYQMIVVGKEGSFMVLAMANLVGRMTTKPIVIAATSMLTALVNRAVYRPVVGRILCQREA